MVTKLRFLGSLVLMAILLSLVATSVASGVINVRNPEAVKKGPVIAPPPLIPPGQMGYANWRSDKAIAAPDGRSVAQLAQPPVSITQAIATNFPDIRPEQDATTVSYTILASVRYTGNGHTVLVTTARPSPAAAQETAVFGNKTVKLVDGSTAWVTTGIPGDIPNQVVLVKDNLIITVAGDLPLNDLQTLAGDIAIK